MGLTNNERLMLYRLHELLAGSQKGSNAHHARAMKSLELGLEDVFPEELWPFESPNINVEAASFVRDIFQLFDKMQYSFYRSFQGQKDVVGENDVLFPGFSAQHEPEYLDQADLFLNRIRLMRGFRLRGKLDSGVPMKAAYKSMLEASKNCSFDSETGYSSHDLRSLTTAMKLPGAKRANGKDSHGADPSSGSGNVVSFVDDVQAKL